MEAIILAGGLGTRLRSVVADLPKPMADINGKPFLEYLLKFLKNNSIKKVILSVGYKYEVIKNYFGDSFDEIELAYSIEDEPLGTGGAIKKSLTYASCNDVIVLNGDTFFNINIKNLAKYHTEKKAPLSLALKKVSNNDRYGAVEINQNYRITGFKEKGKISSSDFLINAGFYAINKEKFLSIPMPDKFSFEKDFLEAYFSKIEIYGFVFDGYFIDIGIPEDYRKACEELKNYF